MPGESLCAVGLFQAMLLILLVGLLCKKKESEQERDSSRFDTPSGDHDEPQGKFWSSQVPSPPLSPAAQVLLEHCMRPSLWREALQASPPSSITFLFEHPVSGSEREKDRCKLAARCSFMCCRMTSSICIAKSPVFWCLLVTGLSGWDLRSTLP